MADQQATVHVVIPNFNGKRFLADCLASLKGQNYSSFAVTVVDNGSSDGSLDYLQTSHPEVGCLALPENRGFSAAVNAGILVGSAPYVFLLNNDTELPPDCLKQLVQAADEQQEFDFFAPKMVSFHDHGVLDGAGDGYLRGGAGYRLGTMERDSARYNRPGPVFGACAGAVLYRRDVFDRVGLFDEDFFAYLEDVDLNLRMSRAGLRGYYVPASVVYHIGSATTGSKINAFTVRLSTRNSFLVLLKNYPSSLFIRFFPVICIYQCCWLLFAVKKGQFSAYCRGAGEMFTQFRSMRRKHHVQQGRAQLSAAEFADCLKDAEKDVLASIIHRRTEQGKGSLLLRVYETLFL
jgi:GT2 family glycosyltransferase